ATPVGPAAGPHTQLAQNIVTSWLTGGRFIELKTVQILDRLELLAFVIPVWLANILFSVIWLRYFRQGPVEWLWRQLTLR
ncbi:DUF418 domain-containing protein, partial [Escherichia coli]|uniref:DUF418 domain-containing protein n=1 Tax=Escherichia coli TaxID=562 RepID=UPI0020341F63